MRRASLAKYPGLNAGEVGFAKLPQNRFDHMAGRGGTKVQMETGVEKVLSCSLPL